MLSLSWSSVFDDYSFYRYSRYKTKPIIYYIASYCLYLFQDEHFISLSSQLVSGTGTYHPGTNNNDVIVFLHRWQQGQLSADVCEETIDVAVVLSVVWNSSKYVLCIRKEMHMIINFIVSFFFVCLCFSFSLYHSLRSILWINFEEKNPTLLTQKLK